MVRESNLLCIKLYEENKKEILRQIIGRIKEEILREYLKINEEFEKLIEGIKKYIKETPIFVRKRLDKDAYGVFEYDEKDIKKRKIEISYKAFSSVKELIVTIVEEISHAIQRYLAYIYEISKFILKEIKFSLIKSKEIYEKILNRFKKYAKWILIEPKNYFEYLTHFLEVEAKRISKNVFEKLYSKEEKEKNKRILGILIEKVIEGVVKEYLKRIKSLEVGNELEKYLKKCEVYENEKLENRNEKCTLMKIYLKNEKSKIIISSLLFLNINFLLKYLSKAYSFISQKFIETKIKIAKIYDKIAKIVYYNFCKYNNLNKIEYG